MELLLISALAPHATLSAQGLTEVMEIRSDMTSETECYAMKSVCVCIFVFVCAARLHLNMVGSRDIVLGRFSPCCFASVNSMFSETKC